MVFLIINQTCWQYGSVFKARPRPRTPKAGLEDTRVQGRVFEESISVINYHKIKEIRTGLPRLPYSVIFLTNFTGFCKQQSYYKRIVLPMVQSALDWRSIKVMALFDSLYTVYILRTVAAWSFAVGRGRISTIGLVALTQYHTSVWRTDRVTKRTALLYKHSALHSFVLCFFHKVIVSDCCSKVMALLARGVSTPWCKHRVVLLHGDRCTQSLYTVWHCRISALQLVWKDGLEWHHINDRAASRHNSCR